MKNKIILLIQIILVIIIILSSIEIIKWVIYNHKSEKMLDELSSSVSVVYENTNSNTITENVTVENNTKYNIDFDNLRAKNSDTVAWIKVNGTSIEYPVVRSTNNNYYLTRSFDKSYNSAGWIFADYRNKLDGTDKNIIIYGHNRRDGSMFGTQNKTLNASWYDNPENLQISFITELENVKYQVFSVYEIIAEDYYIQVDFSNQNFGNFIQTLKQRSIKDFGIEVNENDQILTLSTCGQSNKYRVVLHAKKIQETANLY